MNCAACEDTGWVCEAHPDRSWDGPHACGCGAAGDPCPRCNALSEADRPRPPAGFRFSFGLLADLAQFFRKR